MPTKPNKAGNQQNYVPAGNGDASGEYGDNATGSNIHFTNFKKPDEPKVETETEKPLGVKIDDGGKEVKTDTIKPKYDGKGKSLLNETLKGKLPNSANTKTLLNLIADADDEYSGIIADLYKANPNLNIKLGKNLNSKYEVITYLMSGRKEYEIKLGQGVLDDSLSYSKGGVFFHESGHALDNTNTDEYGHRSYYSNSYMSSKYNTTMSDKIKEELNKNLTPELFKQLKEDIKAEEEQAKAKFFTPEMDKELNEINDKLNNIHTQVANNEEFKQSALKLNSLVEQTEKIKKAMRDYSYEQMYKNYNYNYNKDEEYIKLKQDLMDMKPQLEEALSNKNKVRENLISKYPEMANLNKRQNELIEAKTSSSRKANGVIQVKYGDLSDMCQASLGAKLTGMGHDTNYFTSYRGRENRGTEAFAEIMSAKATNPESLKVLQKYIPQTIEIFDEIINKIKGAK